MPLPYWPQKGKSSYIEQKQSKIMNLATNFISLKKQLFFYRRNPAKELLQ